MIRPNNLFYLGLTTILAVNLITLSQVSEGADRPMNIIPIRVSLGDPLAAVFTTNNLDDKEYREPYMRDGSLAALEARVSDAAAPDGYALHYVDGPCSLALPAGRILHLRHYAGFVKSIAHVFPTEALNYTEALALVDALMAMIEGVGFVRRRFHEPPRDESPKDWMDFPVATWQGQGCSLSNSEIELVIVNYNKTPPAPTTPPMIGTPIPKDAPPRYLIRLVIDHEEILHEASDLMKARRKAIHGNGRKFVPLSVWLDSPDWRPEGWDGQYIK